MRIQGVPLMGLMSGTSADGVDAALISLRESKGKTGGPRVRVHAHAIYPFPTSLRRQILAFSEFSPGSKNSRSGLNAQPAASILALHVALGERFADAATKIAREAGVSLSKVKVIGSHGQTISHRPPLGPRRKPLPGSLQLGEAALIAERTGVTTVADFRPSDIAAGGLGAPLTPYAHRILFARPDRGVLVINLGGVANVTFIPPADRPDDPAGLSTLRGFDTGPGNLLMDAASRQVSRGKRPFDPGGSWALRGRRDDTLLCWLMRHPFIRRPPPKATGREDFGQNYLEEVMKMFLSKRGQKTFGIRSQSFRDLMATLSAFTTQAIGKQVKRFLLPRGGVGGVGGVGEVVVCGGGVHNRTLMAGLAEEFPEIPVVRSDDRGVPADAVEAAAFALLADAALQGIPANVPAITGARRAVVLGKVIAAGGGT